MPTAPVPAAAPWTLARMLTPRRHRDPEYALRIAGELYGGSARHDPDGAVGALHRAVSGVPRRAYLYQLLAVAGWTSLPLLPRIRQPALVVAGDDDPLIPAVNASIMTWLLPRGRLHLYHGGHLHLLTDPAALVPVIETFLDATDQRATDQQEDVRR
ncbi:MAG: hypothetical protein M3235_00330 [Actinomycetota bacterium]|nr:hypothetical protein [Actinomycetota bacterium]